MKTRIGDIVTFGKVAMLYCPHMTVTCDLKREVRAWGANILSGFARDECFLNSNTPPDLNQTFQNDLHILHATKAHEYMRFGMPEWTLPNCFSLKCEQIRFCS